MTPRPKNQKKKRNKLKGEQSGLSTPTLTKSTIHKRKASTLSKDATEKQNSSTNSTKPFKGVKVFKRLICPYEELLEQSRIRKMKSKFTEKTYFESEREETTLTLNELSSHPLYQVPDEFEGLELDSYRKPSRGGRVLKTNFLSLYKAGSAGVSRVGLGTQQRMTMSRFLRDEGSSYKSGFEKLD